MREGALEVKICGLTRGEDVRLAVAQGADYVGFVLSEGFARSVDPERAAAMAEGVGARRVAVLVDEGVDRAEARARVLGAHVLQLHGDEDRSVVDELRARGAWKIWKGVRARSVEDVVRAVEVYGASVDGILVEGWREGVAGGGGVRLDADPRRLRSAIVPSLRFVLAGGLTPANVGEAVVRFGPDVVDVSSGVERRVGSKDPDLVRSFIESARREAEKSTSGPTGIPSSGASA